ncbi:SETMR methyltransferase, partial [Acromyrmex insinuator]
LKMNEISEEIRYVMLFYKKGKNAAQTCRQICEVYGADAVSERRTQEWFVRFRSGNFNVKDRPRSGRPVTEKVDEILQLVKQLSGANALRINHMTVWNHLKKTGYAKKFDVWVSHELTQRNLIDRISISETLLKRNEIDPFLKQIITGDEKWVKYKNINSLDGKTLADKRAAENHLKKFFADKPQKFYTDRIMKLPEKWQKVIDNNGQYILD